VHTFAGTAARRMAPDVIAAARAWGADLIVREGAEFGGFAAAEALGLPHASIEAPSTSALDQRALLTPPLSALCAVVGLPAASAPEMPYRYLNLCFMPRRFHGPDAIIPRTTHFLRHTNQSRPGEALPAWVTGLPHRPTVLASLGTIFYRIPGLLQAIIAALRDEPVNVVVAIGRDGDPKALGPQPANVHVERYLPQTLLLPHCSLFVTHAGFNSVKESLSFGVPMVAVPIAAEQPYTAERCVALGVADVVSPREWGPERIRAAARTVLGDPSYRQRAWTVQAEMSALPGLERAVDLLERLAEGSEPLPDETPTGSSCTSVEERPV